MSRHDDDYEGPTSLPRDRVGDGAATEAQWSAATRWSARYRKSHLHADPWARFDLAEEQDERRRFGPE